MRVFFDTSALVKRYIDEPGSDTVASILEQTTTLTMSVLCRPECISAFQRLLRAGHLSEEDYRGLKTAAFTDLADTEICHLVPEVVDLAVACLERYPLRTLDALHLGCALAVAPDLFVSGDQRQIEAARLEGLEVRLV